MSDTQRPRGLGAAARATALAASVMDLHVRMALQEVDREKRRLISGGLFLATGGVAMLIAMAAGEVALVLWIQKAWELSLMQALLALAVARLLSRWRCQAAGRCRRCEMGACAAADAGVDGGAPKPSASSRVASR